MQINVGLLLTDFASWTALSMASLTPRFLETGVRVGVELIKKLQAYPLESDSILNINVPDIPYGELRGFLNSCSAVVASSKAEPIRQTLKNSEKRSLGQ